VVEVEVVTEEPKKKEGETSEEDAAKREERRVARRRMEVKCFNANMVCTNPYTGKVHEPTRRSPFSARVDNVDKLMDPLILAIYDQLCYPNGYINKASDERFAVYW
jgi:hypothetical protein